MASSEPERHTPMHEATGMSHRDPLAAVASSESHRGAQRCEATAAMREAHTNAMRPLRVAPNDTQRPLLLNALVNLLNDLLPA